MGGGVTPHSVPGGKRGALFWGTVGHVKNFSMVVRGKRGMGRAEMAT